MEKNLKQSHFEHMINRSELEYSAYHLPALLESDDAKGFLRAAGLDERIGESLSLSLHPELGAKNFRSAEELATPDLVVVIKTVNRVILIGIECKMFTKNVTGIIHQMERQQKTLQLLAQFYKADTVYQVGLTVQKLWACENQLAEGTALITWSNLLAQYSGNKHNFHFKAIERAIFAYEELKSNSTAYASEEAKLTYDDIRKYQGRRLWVGYANGKVNVPERISQNGYFSVNFTAEEAPNRNYQSREDFLEKFGS